MHLVKYRKQYQQFWFDTTKHQSLNFIVATTVTCNSWCSCWSCFKLLWLLGREEDNPTPPVKPVPAPAMVRLYSFSRWAWCFCSPARLSLARRTGEKRSLGRWREWRSLNESRAEYNKKNKWCKTTNFHTNQKYNHTKTKQIPRYLTK